MVDIEAVREMIARVIDDFGGSSAEGRMDRDSWIFRKGSTTGFVMVNEDKEDPQAGDFLVVCEIMRVPSDGQLPFFRRLLELNDRLCGKAAFGVNEDGSVLLQAGRKLRGIDATEIADLMLRTASLADRYDDLLLDEFGRENAIE